MSATTLSCAEFSIRTLLSWLLLLSLCGEKVRLLTCPLGGVLYFVLIFAASSCSCLRNHAGAVMCMFWDEIWRSSSLIEKVAKSTSCMESTLRHWCRSDCTL